MQYLGHNWTDNEYAENGDAYNNAINSIDKLAESHPEMKSYIDGEFKSNSDMLLYKLYQANILAPNADAIADNGEPIGQVLSYTDENGNTTTYQDVYHKLLNGEELTEADAKVLLIVDDHVGGQHENGVNDMGKLKDFDKLGDGKNPDSYNKDADVGYEPHDHPGEESLYGRYIETIKDETYINPFTMVHDNQDENRALAARQGANARAAAAMERIHKKKQQEDTPDPDPIPNPILIRTPIKEELQPFAVFEYQVLKGKDPQTDPKGDPQGYQDWIVYCAQVEAERKRTEAVRNAESDHHDTLTMEDFLEGRRKKFIENVKGNSGMLTRKTQQEINDDFDAHSADPQNSFFCQNLYQNIGESNKKTPFKTFEQITHYAGEYARHTPFVQVGTRDIEQMSNKQKQKIAQNLDLYNPSSRIFAGSLDEFYQEEKTAEEYEHQGQMYKSDSKYGWRYSLKEIWGKLGLKKPQSQSRVPQRTR